MRTPASYPAELNLHISFHPYASTVDSPNHLRSRSVTLSLRLWEYETSSAKRNAHAARLTSDARVRLSGLSRGSFMDEVAPKSCCWSEEGIRRADGAGGGGREVREDEEAEEGEFIAVR